MLPNIAALPLQAAQPLSSPEPTERAEPPRAGAPTWHAEPPRAAEPAERTKDTPEQALRHRAAGALRTLSTSSPATPQAAPERTSQQAAAIERQPPLSWHGCARLGASGLALAALFGAAGGARYGLGSALLHGLGAPLAFAAVTLVVVPSLYVAFAYVDVVIAPREAGSICARALLSSGSLLAGLAPALLMLAVSVESNISAGVVTWMGLLAAGCLGLRRVVVGLDHAADDEQLAPTVARRLLLTGFIVVAAVTALRIWWLAMPMLGGGR